MLVCLADPSLERSPAVEGENGEGGLREGELLKVRGSRGGGGERRSERASTLTCESDP